VGEAAASAISGDRALGATAFLNDCASCHAARDGFDLALFSFTDTTIVRRALAHVDLPTARDIVAHVRSIRVTPAAEDSRPFQPGGRVLANDRDFAIGVFGADGWPAYLTTADLRRVDPRRTAVAVEFPIWSLEGDNRDWMPAIGLPPGILEYRDDRAARALAAYYRTPTTQALVAAVGAIGAADRDPANPDAPCVMEPIDRLRPEECFEARRWAASLGAQHMLRHGSDMPVHRVVHGLWWDVGNVSRRTVTTEAVRGRISNGVDNWVSWMWIGWTFDPAAHASIYLANGLSRKGLWRHATFHILRAQVARAPGSVAVYHDLRNVPRFAPDGWLKNAMVFGFRHLLERLDAGEAQVGERRDEALVEVELALRDASRRLSGPDAQLLRDLRDQVVARLD
jgi:hypothetical protein